MEFNSLHNSSIPEVAEKIRQEELGISEISSFIEAVEYQIESKKAQAYFDACKLPDVKSEESKRQAVITLMNAKDGHLDRLIQLSLDKETLARRKADHAFYKRILAYKMVQLAHQ